MPNPHGSGEPANTSPDNQADPAVGNPFDPPVGLSHVEIDPDVDLRVAEERDELRQAIPLLAAIAIGGMIGATGRYAIAETWTTPAAGFPWSTLIINVTGCFALGILMTYIAGRDRLHPLARPFIGTGIISGYTTFSTYAVEAHQLLMTRHPAIGLAYLAGSVIVGLAAVVLGRATAIGARRVVSPFLRGRA